MVYGYARVSTRGQAKDGNSLEAQENALRSAGATKIYADAFTGTRTKRPEMCIRDRLWIMQMLLIRQQNLVK